MNLWQMKKGDLYEITGISYDLDEKVRDRLEEIGLSVSQFVICLRRSPFNGPIILKLGGTAFALEQEIAQLIQAKSRISSL